MKVSLVEQIAAVETEYVNLRGSIEILEDLVRKKKRDELYLNIKKSRLASLGAALNTLKFVQKHEDAIRTAIQSSLQRQPEPLP